MSENNARKIAEAVAKFLRDDGCRLYEEGRFRFTWGLEKDDFRHIDLDWNIKCVNVVINVEEEGYAVMAFLPVGVNPDKEDKKRDIAEFVTRVNLNFKHGELKFDWESGTIWYDYSVICTDALPSEQTIKNSIHDSASCVRRYAKGILLVLNGGHTPEKAIELCESDLAEEADNESNAVDTSLVRPLLLEYLRRKQQEKALDEEYDALMGCDEDEDNDMEDT